MSAVQAVPENKRRTSDGNLAEIKISQQTFDVGDWKYKHKRQRLSCPAKEAPQQLGVWTKTSETLGGEYLYGDNSGLPSYTGCDLPCDLNEGYPEKFIEKKETGAFIGHVLSVIRQAQSLKESISQDEFDIITFRNNLNKIGLTLHQPRNAWTVDACMLDGTLVLEIIHIDDGNTFPNQHKFMYYGYKFEALCTNEESVDSTSEFGVCVKLNLGNLKLGIGAEIDCCDPKCNKNSPNLSDYLELKCYRMPQNQEQHRKNVRNKHPRWWLQSWIVGVPKLVLGARDDDGMLREIHIVEVNELSQISQDMGAGFNQWEILNFIIDVLQWMRECAKQMSDSRHLRFQYNPQARQISCECVENSDLYQRMREVWTSNVSVTDPTQEIQPQMSAQGQQKEERNKGNITESVQDSRGTN